MRGRGWAKKRRRNNKESKRDLEGGRCVGEGGVGRSIGLLVAKNMSEEIIIWQYHHNS